MEIKKTPFYEAHQGLEAKMVEFAGYLMPLWYESVKEEAIAVRKAAGLFDISHMGKILIRGRNSLKLIQKLITNDASRLKPGKICYALLCNEKGTVIDDILVYGLGKERYLLVSNAANAEKVLNWLKKWAKKEIGLFSPPEIILKDCPFLALQGPKSEEILRKVGLSETFLNLRYYQCKAGRIFGETAIISRTGYTGEDGFEILIWEPKTPQVVWKKLLKAGRDLGLKPAGLAARDVLRLEAGLPLYGQELSEEITALEAGLEKFVFFGKEFIGKEALLEQKNRGLEKKLIGFEILSGRIARPKYLILKEGREIGQVASGNISHNLNKSIGTGFVKTDFSAPGTLIEIDIRGQKHPAKVSKLPFVKPR
ncbi:MAG: glycine cleavage system protein T [Parcubacteria group bacterium CG11_big_fil_rev_8_21_14_0_20_39_14]|nr:MAG: glycine cleavage system protein T [Parcubacteria group bacterium CG11_big_fil_rev_8_21_14_0_20_39_14]